MLILSKLKLSCVACIAIACITLAACGQSGPLYLPKEQSADTKHDS